MYIYCMHIYLSDFCLFLSICRSIYLVNPDAQPNVGLYVNTASWRFEYILISTMR